MSTLEAERSWAEKILAELEAFDTEYRGRPVPEELVRKLQADTQRASNIFRLGAFTSGTSREPHRAARGRAACGVGIAAVIVSCDALENTRRCIETLQAKEDPRHPQTIVVVDNGSSDGSAEWLAEQDGVHLIRNEINHGAPRARNQAIRWLMEQGECPEWFLFLDNDVFVTEGWAHRALYHGEVDPAVGSVALCASRASKKQVVPYDGPDDQASLDAFAPPAGDAGRRGVDDALHLLRGSRPFGGDRPDRWLRRGILALGLRGRRHQPAHSPRRLAERVAMDTYVHHAHYGTREKSEWHDRWMAANWNAFVDKWCPSASARRLRLRVDPRAPAR